MDYTLEYIGDGFFDYTDTIGRVRVHAKKLAGFLFAVTA